MLVSNPSRDYVNEDGQPMRCGDCNAPTYYDYADEAYHHAVQPQNGCGLIPSEDRDADESHPLITDKERRQIEWDRKFVRKADVIPLRPD